MPTSSALAYTARMLNRLINRLLAPSPERLAPPDAQAALAALLVRVARADGRYDTAEMTRIDLILATRYALNPFAASELRSRAEALESEAPDTVRFTRALKDAVPYEDRASLMEAFWRVALADDARDPEEEALIRLVANLLGITDKDSALARQRVQGRP